jgi:phosphoglucomutase
MKIRILEEKIKNNKLSGINVPYEKEKLKAQLYNLNTQIEKNFALNMHRGLKQDDPIVRLAKLKHKRLENLLTKIETLETAAAKK